MFIISHIFFHFKNDIQLHFSFLHAFENWIFDLLSKIALHFSFRIQHESLLKFRV
jgi:hypothetical protein